jgi:branched-chain amino acid transport system substrate-binding protein
MIAHKRVRTALVIALIGIVLVACSSSKKATSSTAATSAAASGGASSGGAATGSPLSLEWISSFPSPANPAEPEVSAAMQARMAEVNATGGIGGHPLKLVVCSDQGDANQSRNCANDAVSNSNVIATVFNYTNNGAIVNPILEQAGLAQIGIDPQGDDLKCSVCFAFWGGGITDSVGEPALLHTYDSVNSVGIMCPAVPVCPTEVGYGKDSFQQLVPNATVLTQETPFATADLSAAVEAFKSVDGVALLTGGSQLLGWFKTAHSLGLSPKYAILGTTLTPDLITQAGGLFNNALLTLDTAPPTSNVKGAVEYRADLAKYAPSGTAIDQNGMYGWMDVKAIADVASTIKGPITRAAIMTAFTNLRDYTGFDGLIPPYSTNVPFTGLNGAAPRLFNPTLYPARLVNGVQTPLGDTFYNPFTGKSVAAS